MQILLSILNPLDFRVIIWLFPSVIAVHELEEWNYANWYRAHFVDLPPISPLSIRIGLAMVTFVHVVWCGLATISGHPVAAAVIYLPAIAFACQNALQHILWCVRFRGDLRGVITAALLVLPTGVYLFVRAIQVNRWLSVYVALLIVMIVPGLVRTDKAGNTMPASLRKLNTLCIRIAERLSALSKSSSQSEL
jgi:hypothetical protein